MVMTDEMAPSAPAVMAGLAEFDVAGQATIRGMEAQKSYKYGYWRRPDGWIVTAPTWPTEKAAQMDEGWEFLKQYGEFTTNNAYEPGGAWNIGREPWRRIMRLEGGPSEFSVEQVLEHGWHRKAPYRGVKFPQLRGVDHEDVVCDACKKPFIKIEDLARHEQVSHRQASEQQSLARALGDTIKASERAGRADGAVLAQLVDAVARLAQLQEAQAATGPGRAEKKAA